VPAEIAGQRPLLERAAAGDREAFAQLYDAQVEGVYRYLLAWTGNRQQAAGLTAQVFHTALGWLASAHDREMGAWLIALARDAMAERRGSAGATGSARVARLMGVAGTAGPAGGGGSRVAAGDAVGAVARLADPEREVVVLRLLLGHSLAHTAHLSGYSQRAVLELQLAACLTISELTGATPAGGGPEAPTPATSAGGGPEARTPAAAAGEFERRLGPWETDGTASDPSLADALAVADALRQAIPGYLVAPTPDLIARLRQELLTTAAPDPPHGGASLTGPVPGAAPPRGSVAEPENGRARLSTGTLAGSMFRRPWVATGVATAGIILVLTLQAFGKPGPAPSPTSTTVAVAAGGTSLGTPLTTVLEPSTTTSSTQPTQVPATSAPRAATPPAPPTTRPVTTAPQTTSAPRPTTTRAPTTTVATTTTAPATTTTSAPVPAPT
jgi:DNA-directed RNA polymerase specialized sigma24 family protein